MNTLQRSADTEDVKPRSDVDGGSAFFHINSDTEERSSEAAIEYIVISGRDDALNFGPMLDIWDEEERRSKPKNLREREGISRHESKGSTRRQGVATEGPFTLTDPLFDDSLVLTGMEIPSEFVSSKPSVMSSSTAQVGIRSFERAVARLARRNMRDIYDAIKWPNEASKVVGFCPKSMWRLLVESEGYYICALKKVLLDRDQAGTMRLPLLLGFVKVALGDTYDGHWLMEFQVQDFARNLGIGSKLLAMVKAKALEKPIGLCVQISKIEHTCACTSTHIHTHTHVNVHTCTCTHI